MGREPEVGVEDGLQHLEGVAPERKVVGDDERGEAEDRAGGQSDGVLPDGFEEQAEPDGAPADEDGGAVEVGDGWSAFEPHAGDERHGMDHEGNGDEREGGTSGPVGEGEPVGRGEQERDGVQGHGFQEGLEIVVGLFAGGLADLGAEGAGILGELRGDELVERRRLTAAIRLGELGVLEHGGMELAGAGLGDEVTVLGVGDVLLTHDLSQETRADAGLEEGVTQLHPLVPGEFRVMRGNDEGRPHGGERQELLAVIEDGDEGVGVEGTAGKAIPEGFGPGGDGRLVGGDVRGEVGAAGRLQGGLEHGVQAHRVAELQDGTVVGGVLGLVFGGGLGLLLNFLPRRHELVPGVVLAVLTGGLIGVHGELELALEIGVIDAEGLALVGDLGTHHDLDGPFGGGERALLGGVPHRLLVADLEEGIPREGIEGLEAAVEHHGQPAEVVVGEGGILRGAQAGHEPDDRGEGEDPGEMLHGWEGRLGVKGSGDGRHRSLRCRGTGLADDEGDEMDKELDGHSSAYDDASDVGRDPRWILHDLQHGGPGVRIEFIEAGLEVGEPSEAQGVVHVDVHLAGACRSGIMQADAAAEVLGLLGTDVFVVLEGEQFDGVRRVVTGGAQGDLVPAVFDGELLWGCQRLSERVAEFGTEIRHEVAEDEEGQAAVAGVRRHEPGGGAGDRLGSLDVDHREGNVAAVHRGRGPGRFEGESGGDAGGCLRFAAASGAAG